MTTRASRYKDRWIRCLWNCFEEFRDDMYESYLKHVEEFWEKDTTIDRIDVDWNYCKENCRRATYKQQSETNSKTHYLLYNWKIYNMLECSKASGVNISTLKHRVYRGITEETWLYSKEPIKKRNSIIGKYNEYRKRWWDLSYISFYKKNRIYKRPIWPDFITKL